MSKNQALVISKTSESQAVLQARFHDYGYLHFKAAVNADDCEALLQDILKQLQPHITRPNKHSHAVLNGEPFFETDNIWDEVYPKIQSLESFHNFFHKPELLQLMQTVSGDEVFIYPMKMARIATPKKLGYETPPHQDAYSHHAGKTMAGIWVALHDVTETMGRLKLLPHSHKKGVRPVFQAEGVGGVQCEIYPDETVWHTSNVERGDVIIFNSATVHKAEPNTDSQAVRLSVDTRFCDYGAKVFTSNIEPHHGWRIESLNWENIYKNWRSTDNQYYWQDYPGLFSQFDENLHQ